MMTRAAILRALAGALVMTTAASAQPVLIFAQTAWRAPNDFSIEIGQLFGQGLEAVPDIDGDGVTDLAISIVIPDSPGDPGVWIVSGATGDRLLSIDRANDDALVLQQALLHDKRDEERFLLAVLEADRDNEDARPTVVFANLPDGTIRDAVRIPIPDSTVQVNRTAALFGIVDSDGDGVEDLALIGPEYRDQASDEILAAVTALSGASGEVLWRRLFRNERIAVGEVAVINDQNGDGQADLAFVRADAVSDAGPIAIEIINAKDGASIRSLDPPPDALPSFGAALAQTSAGLLAVGEPSQTMTGRIRLYDLSTDAVVQTFSPPAFGVKNFGWAIVAGTDFSGDGEPDLVISAPGTGLEFSGVTAAAYVLDESDLSLHWAVAGGLTRGVDDLGSQLAAVHGRGDLPALALAAPGFERRGGFFESGVVFLYDPPGQCYADLTGDDVIDGADLGVLVGQWGVDPGPRSPAKLAANFNSDRRVDTNDLSYLVASWGVCPD